MQGLRGKVGFSLIFSEWSLLLGFACSGLVGHKFEKKKWTPKWVVFFEMVKKIMGIKNPFEKNPTVSKFRSNLKGKVMQLALRKNPIPGVYLGKTIKKPYKISLNKNQPTTQVEWGGKFMICWYTFRSGFFGQKNVKIQKSSGREPQICFKNREN